MAWEENSRISLHMQLIAILSRIGVTYTKGCDLVDTNWPESEIISYPLTAEEKTEIQKAVDNVKESDVAVVVLGGGIRTCGENKSRTSLDLPAISSNFWRP